MRWSVSQHRSMDYFLITSQTVVRYSLLVSSLINLNELYAYRFKPSMTKGSVWFTKKRKIMAKWFIMSMVLTRYFFKCCIRITGKKTAMSLKAAEPLTHNVSSKIIAQQHTWTWGEERERPSSVLCHTDIVRCFYGPAFCILQRCLCFSLTILYKL